MIIALAGGVGGAKLANGLAAIMPPDKLLIVVNTGDDFEHLGLAISPDLDTVMYTLAGRANPELGWGLAGETWNFWRPWNSSAARPGFDWATATSPRIWNARIASATEKRSVT